MHDQELELRNAPPAPADSTARPWHAAAVEAAITHYESSAEGLAPDEAARRLREQGPNRLPGPAARRSALIRFAAQFNNVLIYVLLGAAAITAVLGLPIDTAVILLVVLANAVIGFIQEGRAESALEAIRNMVTPHASVLRGGRRMTVPAEEIVLGDLVLLEAGDRVPADVRIHRSRNLRIDEAILTGESVPIEKSSEPVAHSAVLGERTSMAFSGTLVTAGQGTGIVVGTAAQTELGRISTLLGTVESLTTPLVRQMNRFARQLTAVTLGIAAVVFVFAVTVREYAWTEAFMAMVGLAVAAIPEGLPAVMTITLAIGVQRMAARNAIIRRLPAVETLGSVSIICSDKTGTLTRNEMTVRSLATADGVIEVGGAGYEPRGSFSRDGRTVDVSGDAIVAELTRAALLCNDSQLHRSERGWTVDGDPMEGALVTCAVKAGHEAAEVRRQLPRSDEIPFDAQHRFMATLHHSHEGEAFICLKGAPERVLDMCRRQRSAAGDVPLERSIWLDRIDTFASHGQRVLAVATRSVPASQRELTFGQIGADFVLLGLFGFIDPPREEAIAAVEDCRTAGVQVKMITGDHAVTAAAIARQLRMADEVNVTTGGELERMDDSELRATALTTTVFARTSPEHKLRLVQAMQEDGAIVAMTGDGVNDAPALKRADVGVAMGNKGTEAAKEAAEMVLADDNFASIVAAVREGRTVYDNLRKVIGWTLPTNGGEALAIIVAIIFGVTLPMTPVQILWINMVTAITLGLTLAFEPPEPNVMRRAPRRHDEPLISGYLLWRISVVSLLFVAGAFGMFGHVLRSGGSLEEARTAVVNTIVVMEIFYLFAVRFAHMTSFTWRGVLGTPAVLLGVGLVTLLQLAFTYLPFMHKLFQTRPVALFDGVLILSIGVALLVLMEIEKGLVRRISPARKSTYASRQSHRRLG